MPRPLRLLAVHPLPGLLALGILWEGWVVAFNADAVAAGIGVISLAVAGGLYAIISKCGKPLVDLIGEYRKMIAATAPQVATNTEDIAAIRARTEAVEELNETLLKSLSKAHNEINGLKQDAAGIGEAILIGNRDMKDPIRERANP